MSRPEEGQANYLKTASDTTNRDLLVDNARDGSKILRKPDVHFEMDFSATTIEEELYDKGWNRIQMPVGAEPQPIPDSGGRGEPNEDYDEPNRHGQYPGY